MAERNHRIEVRHHGGPQVLEVVDELVPEPGDGEVRVRVLAAGVSAYDRMLRAFAFPGFPRVPFTPGLDSVGTVDAVAAGVTGVEPGQRVAAGPYSRGGGYAEYVCVPADDLVPVPDGVDAAEAVCLVTDYVTAHHVLHDTAKARPGERALVHGAAGGVGSALLELGKVAGLETFGTASARNLDLVASLGATPIDYRHDDFVERIRSLTGDGVDVVFDPIGGAVQLWRSYRCLRPGGRLVWFGVAASSRQGLRIIPESLLMRFVLSLVPDGKHAPMASDVGKQDQRRVLAELLDMLAAGTIRPVVADRAPLVEAARVHELLEHGGHVGKVVLTTTSS
jgi:NADPH2:quinone reductase